MINITIKKIFISFISAVFVSMFAVGGSALATFLYHYLNGEQFGEVITISRIIWFLIIFILSFLFILFGLDKKK
ncbi:hypothetical protein [Lederbergia lenta]|uniref:Uncharacterized protein n=1 Tax=Lederbergia lenta TaxID=1467 RepID=A0A2X4W0H6_LEDLE|nr:hypothetical protein [Lederbergia lenta]MCM3110714.1 hypothetical protein [Lederbergia lenta]MEC2325891.1 hypothetical protein [Lederbergia lenta]SQI53588.1 Uncharacterised protein [Lederbergia lenta]